MKRQQQNNFLIHIIITLRIPRLLLFTVYFNLFIVLNITNHALCTQN